MDGEIKDSETLVRSLYSPSFFDDDRLSPYAFTLIILNNSKREDGVSVLRKDLPEFEHDLKYLKTLKPRNPEDSYAGYASLVAKDVRNIHIKSPKHMEIDVIPKPSKKMKTHSEIILKIEGEKIIAGNTSREYRIFCAKLAYLAQWEKK